MWILLCVVVVVVLSVMLLVVFSRADGDFSLMMKGRTPQSVIEDKVVWITGASQGLGEALAKEYARLGAKLILSARRESELERIKSQLTGKNAPEGVVVLPLDVASEVSILKEAVVKVESAFMGAGIDIMVHNAAYSRPKHTAVEIPEEELKGTFEVNTLAPIRLTSLLLPGMLQRGKGQFVMVSSAAGKVPSPCQSVYAASKHAVNGYFHTLRSEVNQQGIKVCVVCPGPIETSTSKAPRSKEPRMSVEKCAELIVKAAANDMREVWISTQPVLLMLYLMQYFPELGLAVMDRVGPKRVKAYKEGASGYSSNLFFKKDT
ncbi:unnamed protein product [Sphagnum troendelagicum]|uniref:Dehydrogenase/reductase SDR family member 7 n=1 Tax=Sphagnum troendelagicum TaxID=128251 RepID=A0ABP0UQ16_9BRYO